MGSVHTNTHRQGAAFAFHGETHTMGSTLHCRNLQPVHIYAYRVYARFGVSLGVTALQVGGLSKRQLSEIRQLLRPTAVRISSYFINVPFLVAYVEMKLVLE